VKEEGGTKRCGKKERSKNKNKSMSIYAITKTKWVFILTRNETRRNKETKAKKDSRTHVQHDQHVSLYTRPTDCPLLYYSQKIPASRAKVMSERTKARTKTVIGVGKKNRVAERARGGEEA